LEYREVTSISILAVRPAAGSLRLDELVERARGYAEQSQSASTIRAYASDMRDFRAFCDDHGLASFPATSQTIAEYVTFLAQRAKVSTIRRRLAAISVYHQRAGHESPCSHRIVRDVVRGIAREKGIAPAKKDALTTDFLRALLVAIDGDDAAAWRDRAILPLGFAAALRRSELAALRFEDLRWTKQGLLVRIVRSKTDQLGEGVELAVPFVETEPMCAARAVRRYLNVARISSGPVFRSLTMRRELTDHAIDGEAVASLVKRLARRARLGGNFSGHSLRAGFATSAAAAKVSLDAIARTTRHKSLSVLLGYVRPAQAFDDVALTAIFA
jgi:site-specific recombinase XerD